MLPLKKWSRKYPCPHCGNHAGSYHKKDCPLAYASIGKMVQPNFSDLLVVNNILEYIKTIIDNYPHQKLACSIHDETDTDDCVYLEVKEVQTNSSIQLYLYS